MLLSCLVQTTAPEVICRVFQFRHASCFERLMGHLWRLLCRVGPRVHRLSAAQEQESKRFFGDAPGLEVGSDTSRNGLLFVL